MTTTQLLSATRHIHPGEGADALLTCLREALAACDELHGARIARARTSIEIRVVDPATGESAGPVLVCDRPGPSASMDAGPAETTVYLSPEQVRRYCAGDLQLSTALVSGEVRATGPARKFLVVEPIVRSLMTRRSGRRGVA